jgi:hypothetical protein
MKKSLFGLIFFVFGSILFAQNTEKRTISITRTTSKIKIDGKIDEADWNKAPVATDFFHRWPRAGEVATA